MSHTHLADIPATIAALQDLAGRTFLGAVDGGDCIELVFSTSPDDGNLVSIFVAGSRSGLVAFGFVSQEMIDSGYVAG